MDEFCVLVVPTTALMVLVCICACRCKTVFCLLFILSYYYYFPRSLSIHIQRSRVLKMLYYYNFSCYEASELGVNENFLIVAKDFREIKSNGRKNYFFTLCKTLHCLIILKYFFVRALFPNTHYYELIIDFYQ